MPQGKALGKHDLPIGSYFFFAAWQNIKMDGLGLREARKAAGLTIEEVASAVGLSVSQVSRIETGAREPRQIDVDKMLSLYSRPQEAKVAAAVGRAGYNPPPELFGDRDLPVYASVEGGPGAMVVSTEPVEYVPRPWFFKRVKDGYAVLVNGESMSPVYEPGDMVLVNPQASLVKGKDIILIRGEEEGHFDASLKRLIGWTAAEWFLRQFSPPEGEKAEFRRFRHEWPRALRVVGKYDGG